MRLCCTRLPRRIRRARPGRSLNLQLKQFLLISKIKIKMMITHKNGHSIFPALPALSLAGTALTAKSPRRRRPTLSRRELRRLIADMVD